MMDGIKRFVVASGGRGEGRMYQISGDDNRGICPHNNEGKYVSLRDHEEEVARLGRVIERRDEENSMLHDNYAKIAILKDQSRDYSRRCEEDLRAAKSVTGALSEEIETLRSQVEELRNHNELIYSGLREFLDRCNGL